MTLVFGKNEYVYGQDFRYHKGIPEGIEFKVEFFTPDARIKLVGPGYGLIVDGPSQYYGNGALYVSYGQFPKKLSRLLTECKDITLKSRKK